MREILFRGKCTDTGKWYEGQYIHLHKTTYCFKEDYDRNPNNDIHQIVFERMTDWNLPNQHLRADVIPETVGQFTGLTDKNGKKIFEGDIVKADDFIFVVKFGKCGGVANADNYGYMGFYLEPFSEATKLHARYGLRNDMCYFEDIEIIGNIHDNPELLKGYVKNDR